MFNGFKPFGVRCDARFALGRILAYCGDNRAAYVDSIWIMREPVAARSEWQWPLKKASDLFAEARVNVARLPAKARGAR